MADRYTLLRKYWGYDTFRPKQEEIIDSILEGCDTLALLPTGGGKSLCFQMAALLMEGTCIVVSPLIALMKDQVQRLNDKHIKSACIVSGMSSQEVTGVLYNAIAGQFKLLYVSPERLRQRRFIEHLRKMKVSFFAIDEAHCVSQWGYDFRPPYLQVADVRQYHPSVPLLALTATATPQVEADICALLQMKHCRVFRTTFFRPNLHYGVSTSGDKMDHLLRLCLHTEGSGIVYVRSRRQTQVLADTLNANHVSALNYHAGLTPKERDLRQYQWMQGKSQVMVATNAFGLGIDKADVRFVVHWDIPDSLEAYYQEAGRAGRDGQKAEALMLIDDGDVARLHASLQDDYPTLQYIRSTYLALCNYYRIPLGGGTDSRFDFDLEAICRTYNLVPRQFYSACRFLEREGLILIPDREEANSTLHLYAQRDDLYRFQVDHQVLGAMLITILRLFPGVTTVPTPIDERRIAKQMMLETKDVVARLQQVHEMHIADYRPRSRQPQIHFTAPRIPERDIWLTSTDYAHLCQTASIRAEAMLGYVAERHKCRARLISSYFGEELTADCGCCDNCTTHTMASDTDVQHALDNLLQGRPMPVHQATALLEERGLSDVVPALRQLLDKGLYRLDENMCIQRG